jgi:hypothetical protein
MQIENKKRRMLAGTEEEVSQVSAKVDRLQNSKAKIKRIRKIMKTMKKYSSHDKLKSNLEDLIPKQEKIVKLSYNFRKGRNKKRQEDSRKINFIPSTPHNTSQYLISNFSKGRKEQVINLVNEYTKHMGADLYTMMLDEIINVDDICVSGGSMKGIINSNIEMLPFDAEENAGNYSTQGTFNEEDNEDWNYQISRKNSIFTQNSLFWNENTDETQNSHTGSLNSYKQLIEDQKREIERLQQITGVNTINDKTENILININKDLDPS